MGLRTSTSSHWPHAISAKLQSNNADAVQSPSQDQSLPISRQKRSELSLDKARIRELMVWCSGLSLICFIRKLLAKPSITADSGSQGARLPSTDGSSPAHLLALEELLNTSAKTVVVYCRERQRGIALL